MFNPTTRTILAGCLLAALSTGCENQQNMQDGMTADTAAATSTTQSQLLLDVTRQVLADALRDRAQSGAEVPEDWQSEQFQDDVVESIRLQFPETYLVTEAEQRRFQQGQFDDQANAQLIEDLLAEIERRQVRLGTVSGYLAELYRQDNLQGVGLELAARLLEARLNASMMGEMQGAMQGTMDGPAAEPTPQQDDQQTQQPGQLDAEENQPDQQPQPGGQNGQGQPQGQQDSPDAGGSPEDDDAEVDVNVDQSGSADGGAGAQRRGLLGGEETQRPPQK